MVTKLKWLLLAACVLGPSVSAALADTVVVLVRHAEKVDDSRDPDLTERGRTRAGSLADMLRDAGIEAIYSTDFIRTRETARPLARELDIDIEIYDARELSALAARLKASDRRALVVGHSNTTPELVALLGGEPGPAIEDDEYDRLYVVTIPDGASPATIVLRFAP